MSDGGTEAQRRQAVEDRGTTPAEKGTSRSPHRMDPPPEQGRYGLPPEASGLHPARIVYHFSQLVLGRRDGFNSVTGIWEQDMPVDQPQSPLDVAEALVLYGRGRRGAPYDGRPPYELLRQLAVAADHSAFGSRWREAWYDVASALRALLRPNLRLALLWPPVEIPALFRAAADDHQPGAAAVRSALMTNLDHVVIFRAHASGPVYRVGLQNMAAHFAAISLASNDSLAHAGGNGMYASFFVIWKYLQNRSSHEVLAEIALGLGNYCAERFEAEGGGWWGEQAGKLVAAMQGALLREPPELGNLLALFSGVETVLSLLPLEAPLSVAVSVVASAAIDILKDEERKAQERIEEAASRVGVLIETVAAHAITDVNRLHEYEGHRLRATSSFREQFGLLRY